MSSEILELLKKDNNSEISFYRDGIELIFSCSNGIVKFKISNFNDYKKIISDECSKIIRDTVVSVDIKEDDTDEMIIKKAYRKFCEFLDAYCLCSLNIESFFSSNTFKTIDFIILINFIIFATQLRNKK